jgi:hypothetical protein
MHSLGRVLAQQVARCMHSDTQDRLRVRNNTASSGNRHLRMAVQRFMLKLCRLRRPRVDITALLSFPRTTNQNGRDEASEISVLVDIRNASA